MTREGPFQLTQIDVEQVVLRNDDSFEIASDDRAKITPDLSGIGR